MSYDVAFREAWDKGGPKGALELLRGIFHAPENQRIQGKPTDYLSDSDEDHVSPAFGFDRLLRLFQTRWMTPEELLEFVVERLVESRSPGDDQLHRSQPFNALVAIVNIYGHGEANLRSVHVDTETRQWKPQYELYHQWIEEEDNYDPETDDEDDSYSFLYELENGTRYQMKYGDELVEGELLFKHIRLAQYGDHLAKFGRDLFNEADFATFPKALPFHLFVTMESYGAEGSMQDWFEASAPITFDDLADHPLAAQHEESSKPPPELTIEEQWHYLLSFANRPDSSEFAQLVALLGEQPELRKQTAELTHLRLDGSEIPATLLAATTGMSRMSGAGYARLWWSIAGGADTARQVTRKVLDRPLPNFSELSCDEVLRTAGGIREVVDEAWASVPEAERDGLRGTYEGVCGRFRAIEHPVIGVLDLERGLVEEHGAGVLNTGGWGPAKYDLERISAAYVDAVGACIAALPHKFNGYGGSWDFVTGRLQGLGEKAAPYADDMVELLDRYCEPGRRDGQLISAFAAVLYAMGLDEPPSVIRAHCERDQYHMIECYKEWSNRLPARRWDDFAARFSHDSTAFTEAAAWDAVLVDSVNGLDLFASAVADSEHIEQILNTICEAAAAPTELFAKLVRTLASKFDKNGRHKLENADLTARVVRLLSALPDRDDDDEMMLRRARLLLLRWDIDASVSNAEEQVRDLLTVYPEHPMLRFFEVELAQRTGGALLAGKATIAAIRALAEEDLVYRKAFLRFTGAASFDDAKPEHGYTAYRWAFDHQRADAYSAGQFSDGQRAMDVDPFYRGLERRAAKLDKDALEDACREARLEVEFGEEIVRLNLAELAERLTPESWNITSQICVRLMPEHALYAEHLLRAYDWFREDESRRMALLALFWPQPGFRRTLLEHEPFHADVGSFIRHYRGITSAELAREVFTLLAEMQTHSLILRACNDLSNATILGCFKAVALAIQTLGAYDEGIAIIEKMRAETNPKKPEYVLLVTNRGVLEYQKGDVATAAATYDELFAMDWSRFDYRPREADSLIKSFLGGDLDAQIADVFQQYFAMAKFNAACVYANSDRAGDAVDALREAVEMRPEIYSAAKLSAESDFEPIREYDGFADLVASSGGAP